MTESQLAISNQVCALARTLLIVEDDKPFLQRLSRAMEGRGFEVIIADSVPGGLSHIEQLGGTRSLGPAGCIGDALLSQNVFRAC